MENDCEINCILDDDTPTLTFFLSAELKKRESSEIRSGVCYLTNLVSYKSHYSSYFFRNVLEYYHFCGSAFEVTQSLCHTSR